MRCRCQELKRILHFLFLFLSSWSPRIVPNLPFQLPSPTSSLFGLSIHVETGVEGEHCVFVNLAAIAGPIPGKPEAMMEINYKAPAAAARACEFLGFGHFLQSSTQATNAERAGQVSRDEISLA